MCVRVREREREREALAMLVRCVVHTSVAPTQDSERIMLCMSGCAQVFGVVWCGAVWCGVVWCACGEAHDPLLDAFTISATVEHIQLVCLGARRYVVWRARVRVDHTTVPS